MFEWTETESPRLQIMGHNNSVMSCDDISIDQFSFFFPLYSACDYSYLI